MTISVKKRNGDTASLDLERVHHIVEHACRGLAGVSESAVEMNSGLQFFDGIETKDIQEILIRSANDLITLENPNYQFVAARLLLFGLRKSVYTPWATLKSPRISVGLNWPKEINPLS